MFGEISKGFICKHDCADATALEEFFSEGILFYRLLIAKLVFSIVWVSGIREAVPRKGELICRNQPN